MCSSFKSYHIAILAAFEVWAKLYIERKSQEDTQELIQNNISIK
jgi:hypothetical protein